MYMYTYVYIYSSFLTKKAYIYVLQNTYSHDRPIVQGYPDGCQHRFTSPAEAKALPHEGALALVIIGAMLKVDFKATVAKNID